MYMVVGLGIGFSILICLCVIEVLGGYMVFVFNGLNLLVWKNMIVIGLYIVVIFMVGGLLVDFGVVLNGFILQVIVYDNMNRNLVCKDLMMIVSGLMIMIIFLGINWLVVVLINCIVVLFNGKVILVGING